MKYFTRDLYQRCHSRDEAVVDAACAEWERANQAYEQHLQALEPRLPASLRDFAALLLHDAKVQAIGRQGQRLLMVLLKDTPPRDVVLISYDLEGEPALEPFFDSPADWTRPTDFQFDELDAIPEGDHLVYTQSIVFGNGWLLRLRFRDVQVTLARPVDPQSLAAAPPRGGLPRSA
jgi:hypothetical protein